MTAPGWYNAQGDPPGTQRYWDGAQWVGDPVYEPSTTPAVDQYAAASAPGGFGYVGGAPAVQQFPSGLKTLAITVSVLKAIPLVFALFVALWLALVANSLDDEFDEFGVGIGSLVGAAVAIVIVIIIIGGLLIGFQFAGAIKERPMMVFVPALIMSILDGLFTAGSWIGYADAQDSRFEDPSAFGPMLMTVVTALQITIAVQAIKANNKS